MIIIINKSTETDNHHHYQTKWWSVAIDVGFVSTRAISIFRTEKLYILIYKCKNCCQKPNKSFYRQTHKNTDCCHKQTQKMFS